MFVGGYRSKQTASDSKSRFFDCRNIAPHRAAKAIIGKAVGRASRRYVRRILPIMEKSPDHASTVNPMGDHDFPLKRQTEMLL
jgi:hypothetical protein